MHLQSLKGQLYAFLTPSPGLLTAMAWPEALVVVDEVILLTSMVGFKLECRQESTIEILVTPQVNQEAHSVLEKLNNNFETGAVLGT